jgi:hypothetical protein
MEMQGCGLKRAVVFAPDAFNSNPVVEKPVRDPR